MSGLRRHHSRIGPSGPCVKLGSTVYTDGQNHVEIVLFSSALSKHLGLL
jgi:hypothetical protein